MLISEFASGSTSGNLDGPVSPDNYKRAVYRQPPSRFTIEMLPPAKQGGNFSYGMRICPIARANRSSVSTHGSNSEYEIWRRWEDCLWFQEVLELEYRRKSREKRQRLFAGKGVKKNGMYLQDQAASFESLPPGPDPNSIAQDIHAFVPRLTKKGTVFRASQATIDQRHNEVQALVEALFKEDVPTLVKELREERVVRDFFGYWRRDDDLARKQRPRSAKSRTSVSSSIFSTYFSASSPNIQDSNSYPEIPQSPHLLSATPHAHRSPGSSRPSTADPDYKLSNHNSSDENFTRHYGIRSPVSSSSSSSSHGSHASSRNSQISISTTSDVPIIAEEVPIVFGHNPEHVSDHQFNDRPTSVLESLPEDRELPTKIDPEGYLSVSTLRRRKSSAAEPQANRNCQIFTTPPDIPALSELSPPDGQSITSSNYSVRESWQTTASVGESILDGLNMTMPSSPTEISHRSRASTSSIATFMTSSSADAIIPGPMSRSNPTPSLSSRRFRSMSLSEEELWSDPDEEIVDSYFYDSLADPLSLSLPRYALDSRPETPLGHFSNSNEYLTPIFPPLPPSPTTSSTSTSFSTDFPSSPSGTGGVIIIKAAYDSSIVVLRVSRDISFDEMRQRLYKKFVGQEGVPLSESFTVALLLPTGTSSSASGKSPARSNSLSSVGRSGPNQMRPITSHDDWEQATSSTDGGKLTLRILDPLS